MVPKGIARQTINFQKRTVDRALSVADMVQDLLDVWFTMVIEEMAWMPAEGIRITDEWIRVRKSDRRALKNIIDRTYDSIFAMFGETKPPAGNGTSVNPQTSTPKGGESNEHKPNY